MAMPPQSRRLVNKYPLCFGACRIGGHLAGATMEDEKRAGVRFSPTPAISQRLRSPYERETDALLPRHGRAVAPPDARSDSEPPPPPRRPLWRRILANLGWTAAGLGTATGAVGFAPPAYSHVQLLDTPKAPAKPASPVSILPQAGAEHVASTTNREGDGFDDLLREALKHCGEVAIGVCLNIVGTRIARALFAWRPEAGENASAEQLLAEIKALGRELRDLKAQSFEIPGYRYRAPMRGAFGLPSRVPRMPDLTSRTLSTSSDWKAPPNVTPPQDPWSAVPSEEEFRDLEVLSPLIDGVKPAESLADATAALPIPQEDAFGQFGRDICLRLATLARGALCGKDGLAAKVGDPSVEEIAKAIRAAAVTSAFSNVAAYAIAGTAVIISKAGLEHYCQGHSAQE